MTAAALLDGLKARGATVAANGKRLKLSAPPGVLKPRVLDLARRHKVEILQLLDLENRSREYSAPRVKTDVKADRQTERIRRMAAEITPDQLLSARKRIKPTLQKSLRETELLELALVLAHADKREKSLTSDANRPARTFHPRDVYKPENGKEST
jgi:hypothetical protein